jgi:putative SOS response-associated peptidase YedK
MAFAARKLTRRGRHLLYGFSTTEPSSGVAPIHPKAMPVILTTPEDQHHAQVVAIGEREDRRQEKAQSQPSLPS